MTTHFINLSILNNSQNISSHTFRIYNSSLVCTRVKSTGVPPKMVSGTLTPVHSDPLNSKKSLAKGTGDFPSLGLVMYLCLPERNRRKTLPPSGSSSPWRWRQVERYKNVWCRFMHSVFYSLKKSFHSYLCNQTFIWSVFIWTGLFLLIICFYKFLY